VWLGCWVMRPAVWLTNYRELRPVIQNSSWPACIGFAEDRPKR